ncbi:MAG: glycosyltransferase family 4 protein [Polaribacter sp.]
MKPKLIRITTVPLSLEKLLENQLEFMSEFYDITAVSSDKEGLVAFGKNQNVNTFHLELTRTITLLKDVKTVIRLFKFLKKEKPLIVHTHTPKAGIVGMLASYFARVPNRLHTVAGLPLLETKGLKRRILNFVEKITYRCATKIYPNSFGLEKIIIENKFTKKEKLKVIANGSSNGIDTSYFNPNIFSEEEKRTLKNNLKIQKDDFVFIFVGRIVGDKGINELVEAFEKLQNENTKLLLVGSLEMELDPLKEKTLTSIKTHKNIISVSFQKDVRPYFSISDVLVFPSYREGFPNVVMQAGAMNLPSIVTNINGCNEIIEEGINGLIIPVKSVDSIYLAMKKILKNQTLKVNLQQHSRKIIKDRYEQRNLWEALLQEYKSLELNV